MIMMKKKEEEEREKGSIRIFTKFSDDPYNESLARFRIRNLVIILNFIFKVVGSLHSCISLLFFKHLHIAT